ncbi:MAG: hypothetical protein IJB71_04550 [Bacilli bacterium]|nr:hypothetical protein [Bacilli bacterium]
MKNNNKILYISIAILVLAVGIAFGTYAYYQTTISGTISGNVAKWSFKANGQTSSLSIDLGDIYPGKSGTYNVILSAEDSDLDVYYELYTRWADLRYYLYWDANYDKSIGDYIGIYDTIAAGTTKTVPIYFYWPYESEVYDNGIDSYRDTLDAVSIEIVGQQLTGYTGETPMYFYHDIDEYATYSNGFISVGK